MKTKNDHFGENVVTIGSIGFGIAAAGVWYVTQKAISKLVFPVIEKNAKKGLNSKYCLESLYDRAVFLSSVEFKASISLEYEEKCLLNPLKHVHEKNIPETLENYRDLMCGKIVDNQLFHIPSEYIGDKFNPDYLRYLTVQENLYNGIDWVRQELKRVRNLDRVRDVLSKARNELLERGVNRQYLEEAITLERCALFSVEDWHKLVNALEEFDREGLNPVAVKLYLSFEPYAYDMGQMVTLDTLLKYGNNIPVFIQILEAIKDGFTAEDVKACILKALDSSWEKAFQEVLLAKKMDFEAHRVQIAYKNKTDEGG